MEKNRVRCEECGYVEFSQYKYKVYPKCHGAMHSGIMPKVVVNDIKETLKLMGEK